MHSVLLPLCAQAFLTFAVWFWMYYERIGLMFRKRIHTQDMSDAEFFDREFKSVVNSSDNLENLFEVPMLFFAWGLIVHVTGLTDSLSVILAYVYVGLRALHSLIHCSYNRVMHRFLAYAVSCFLLLFLWLRVFIQLKN